MDSLARSARAGTLPRHTDVTMRIAENSHSSIHHHCTDYKCHEFHIPRNDTDANEDRQHEIHADNGIEIYHLSAVSCVGGVISIRHDNERVQLYIN